jgi:malyl-CoA/(S)-citramalyl-CoA lyase
MLTDPGDDSKRETHWGDMWHYALSRLVVAARARGIRPLDGPYGNFRDADGFLAAAKRAAALGCEGKWAIHPSQVALANAVFTPSADEVAQARRIIAAMEAAARDGKGAAALDGKLIDYASIRQAENLVRKADLVAASAT